MTGADVQMLIDAAVEKARAEEREACAKLAEETASKPTGGRGRYCSATAKEIARSIRESAEVRS